MRRVVLVALLVLTTAALAVPAALAQSPHFIRASATLNNDGTLTVSWKEAGLGNNQLISYTASADATATYVCVNRGGANPSAPSASGATPGNKARSASAEGMRSRHNALCLFARR